MGKDLLLIGGHGFVGGAVLELARRTAVPMRAPTRREADILRPETLEAAMRSVSTVIHAAGAAHLFQPTPESEAAQWRTNVEGTRNVIRAARRAGVGHVVLISSVSVYSPETVYATSKVKAEEVAIEEAGDALALTILRLATVYGEGDPGNVLRLIKLIQRRRFIWIGRGMNRKSLIHRDDAAAAILKVTRSMPVRRELFDVTAPAVPMRNVVDAITTSLGRTPIRWHIDERLARGVARALAFIAPQHSKVAALRRMIALWTRDDVYDGSAFQLHFDFQPMVTLEEGIGREVAWHRDCARGVSGDHTAGSSFE